MSTVRSSLRLFCSLVACFAAPLVSANAQTILGPITNPANNHRYYAVRIANFADFNIQATALGGYPVVINNAAENDWVYNNVVNALPAGEYAYIGYTDTAVAGEYRWEAGVVDRYTNWMAGEPNNFGGAQRWAIFPRNGTRQWDDWIAPAPYGPNGNPNQVLPAAIVEVSSTASGPGQPTGLLYGPITNPLTNKDYYVTTASPANAAQDFATASLPAGARLATIENADENFFIARHIMTLPNLGDFVNIGLRRTGPTTFAWLSGNTSSYRRWAPGQPNSAGNNIEVSVGTSSAAALGFWYDFAASNTLPSLIEVDRCPADFNRSGVLTPTDIFDFLNAYFSGC